MQNILVTGGAGFIGSNFIRLLLAHEPDIRIVNLDALTYAGSLENMKDLTSSDRYVFSQGDICDAKLVESLLRVHNIDTLVHFAAESHVDRSIAAPDTFIRTNIVGTFTLLEAARKVWIEAGGSAGRQVRFHHISTDEVYGSLGPDEPAFSERSPYAPNSPYAASKAASDHLVRSYMRTYGLPVTITNCSNNYGPRQFPEKLIPLVILNALEGKELPVYGDGQQVRDWLFVDDHCEAILAVLRQGAPGETYNIGGGNQPTNLSIVEIICDLLEECAPERRRPYRDLIQFVADRPGHDRRYAMDNTKMRTQLGWHPRHALQDGLRETVKWYLSNPEWIIAVRAQPGYQQWLDQNYSNREPSL